MNAWDAALNVVKTLAPTIATVIGGPLAGGAVVALESVFGITPKPDASTDDRQAALAAAISGATPEQLAAMRKADQDYALAMAQAGFKNTETLASLSVQDRASARAMQISSKSMTAPFLAVFVTLGFFGCLGLMMFYPIQKEAHDALMLMLGALGASWSAVVAYYFGSSQSSDRKTELLAQSQPVTTD
jgi:fructoselysine-6-P-deglycase FrlB-like protein